MSCYFNHYKIYDSGGNEIKYFTQWDTDRTLVISTEYFDLDEAPLFHFCNQRSKEALVVLSTMEDDTITVKVPNKILKEPFNVVIYIYSYDSKTNSSGKTVATLRIPLQARCKPSDYPYGDADSDLIIGYAVVYNADLMAIEFDLMSMEYEYNGGSSGDYELEPATTEDLGGVIIGENINVTEDGTISISTATETDIKGLF